MECICSEMFVYSPFPHVLIAEEGDSTFNINSQPTNHAKLKATISPMHHLTNNLIYPPGGSSLVAASPPSTPLQHTATFTLFPILPIELRLKIWQSTLPRTRVLRLSHSALHRAYIPNCPPPQALFINRESRTLILETHTYLFLGPKLPHLRIPFSPSTDTIYIGCLAPILSSHLPDLLYNLSTAPSRHSIRKIAFDLRVWNECCEAGLMGVLARMKVLIEVDIVVEFGRRFRGEIGFLLAPEWRGDLKSLADRAQADVRKESARARVFVQRDADIGNWEREIDVNCMLLTRGGEQA